MELPCDLRAWDAQSLQSACVEVSETSPLELGARRNSRIRWQERGAIVRGLSVRTKSEGRLFPHAWGTAPEA